MENNNSFAHYQNKAKQNKLNNMKEMKYKKSNNFVKDYIVFDLETTGVNCYNNEIIEIGAIKYKDFVEVDRFQQIIKPKGRVDPFILRLTGITKAEIDNGLKIESVIDDFLEFIKDFPLVAHNASFDMKFLMYTLIKTGRKYREITSIDTVTLARRYIDETENHKLETLKNLMNMNNKSHRAIDDCLVTNEVYKLCYARKDDLKYTSNIGLRKKVNLNELTAELDEKIDKNHSMYNVEICFTGALKKFTRKEIGQTMANLGANPQNDVTPTTEYLVLGEKSYLDYIQTNKKSSKLNKALKYREAGQSLKIISEGDFIDILEKESES